MRKFDRAVGSATQSGDTELITQVLLEMKMHMMLSNLHVSLAYESLNKCVLVM